LGETHKDSHVQEQQGRERDQTALLAEEVVYKKTAKQVVQIFAAPARYLVECMGSVVVQRYVLQPISVWKRWADPQRNHFEFF